MNPPSPAPILDLVDIIADRLVSDYLAEQAGEPAAANDDKSNVSAPPLARTGTDGE